MRLIRPVLSARGLGSRRRQSKDDHERRAIAGSVDPVTSLASTSGPDWLFPAGRLVRGRAKHKIV